jgi:hypothetical protein
VRECEANGRPVTCPFTRQPLALADLQPDSELLARIRTWRAEHGCALPEDAIPTREQIASAKGQFASLMGSDTVAVNLALMNPDIAAKRNHTLRIDDDGYLNAMKRQVEAAGWPYVVIGTPPDAVISAYRGCPGGEVEVMGLKKAAHHNGRRGKLVQFIMKDERWVVELDAREGEAEAPKLRVTIINLKIKRPDGTWADPSKVPHTRF